MSKHSKLWMLFLLAGLLVFGAGCVEREGETAVTAVPPTPTRPVVPTVSGARVTDHSFMVVATDAPDEPFTDFNAFGEITGLMADVMDHVAAAAGLEYEFVATPYTGALNSIGKDFDAVMSTLSVPESGPEGVAYTVPYLQLGQVLVVLADERAIQTYTDVQPGMTVGVQRYSSGEAAAAEVLNLPDTDIYQYDSVLQAVEALVDELVDAVVMDHFSAAQFANAYPEQLKIVGGEGPEAWLTSKAYSIAVSAASPELLERLNEAIVSVRQEALVDEAVVTWLVPDVTQIDVGESRVGTPVSELVIGIVGELTDMDPAGAPSLIGWEVKQNTMSGLYRYTADNRLEALLAVGEPTISEDKLEYTIRLRTGLTFPDGSALTADDVKWSIDRASVAGAGSFLINAYLKDDDDNGFADTDAVQVIDPFTVKFVLQEPTAYFPALLAVPPYYPVSDECYSEVFDPLSTCGGIGPYQIAVWEPGERMRLQANPSWPGELPAFANIQLRFYQDAEALRRSLADFQSIDVAWSGLSFSDYRVLANQDADADGRSDFTLWQGPGVFKSYLIFEQSTPPWDNALVRRAAAYAIDREALAEDVFNGSRLPLYSPVPDAVPGHLAVLPERDLDMARSLLAQVGYSAEQPLPITIWYLNDGRYTILEEAYATAIKRQLEETGVFQVTLSGAPWEVFQTQIFSCSYPAYLLGWPSPGAPVSYMDVTSWTDFFVQNTDRVFCSNYESERMAQLVLDATEATDTGARFDLYAQIQLLWAEELPTLDLTQEPRWLLSLAKVTGVQIDAMGLLRYDQLVKEEAE